MKAKKIIKTTVFSVAALAFIFGSFGQVSAYEDNFDQDKRRSEVFESLSSDQKEGLKQVRELMMRGEKEDAKAVLESLGIDKEKIKRLRKKGRGIHRVMKKDPVLKQAVLENNYQSFIEASQGKRIGSLITEDLFGKLVSALELRESGDKEGARAIMEEFKSEMKKIRELQVKS